MNTSQLWNSGAPEDWDRELRHYWDVVQNVNLERELEALKVETIEKFSPEGWYKFLHDKYFRWKYTAKNRYVTTSSQLEKYLSLGELGQLDCIRQELLALEVDDVRGSLRTAMKIRGLGTAGASGLLALIYPEHFGTVDQFVVIALRLVDNLPEHGALSAMKPQNLSLADGEILINILRRKAKENNRRFETLGWTARKIDMALWALGR